MKKQKTCLDCGADITKSHWNRRYCELCSVGNAFYRRYVNGQQDAVIAVNRIVSAGAISMARSCKCVDCGRDAHAYDHRDYSRPLDIEPVCASCNAKRGPAKPLSPMPYERLRKYFAEKNNSDTVIAFEWWLTKSKTSLRSITADDYGLLLDLVEFAECRSA